MADQKRRGRPQKLSDRLQEAIFRFGHYVGHREIAQRSGFALGVFMGLAQGNRKISTADFRIEILCGLLDVPHDEAFANEIRQNLVFQETAELQELISRRRGPRSCTGVSVLAAVPNRAQGEMVGSTPTAVHHA